MFNNGRYTTNIPTDPHTVTTTETKTNMRHIHTSIVSRHLATRGNNKILRTPPPHISSIEERLPHLTRRILAQLRTNKSYLHKVDVKTHPHTHHIVTPGFLDRPRRSDYTAGQIGGEADWWTTSRNIGLPPTSKGHGSW